MHAETIHLVKVTTDERTHQLWAAKSPRDDAVSIVLNAIPEGWTACLLGDSLHEERIWA